MNIVLIGFKGAGKTHVGKAAAALTGLPHLDTDALIIGLQGTFTSISDLYRTLGPKAFRSLERQVIDRLMHRLSTSTVHIITCGGGSVLEPKSVELLSRNGLLIHIKTPFDIIKNNFKPSALCSDLQSLQALYDERLPLYKSVAHLEIEDREAAPMIIKDLYEQQFRHAFSLH